MSGIGRPAKKMIGALAAVFFGLLAFSATPARAATVVTFDDLPQTCCSVIPNGYGGINWNGNWEAGPQAPPYNPESPPNVAVEFNVNPDAFTFTAPVVFSGAYFSGPDNFSTVNFQLYLGGNLEATSASLTTSSTPTFLASGYSGLVDNVVVTDSFAEDVFAMDNVTYTTVPAPPIGRGLPVLLTAGGMLFGAKLLERSKKRHMLETAAPNPAA
jgi:hypothetical protein